MIDEELKKVLDAKYEKEKWVSKLIRKREDGEYERIYEIPRDEEDTRFVKHFSVNEVKEYKEFFDRYGFVVVRDILTPVECSQTIDDIWQTMETSPFYKKKGIKREDKKTHASWPGGMAAIEGIIGEVPLFSKSALENRQNPNFYSVYSQLLDDPNLIVNHDRYGLFRATKGEGAKSSFATKINTHFDFNPFAYVLDPPEEVANRSNSVFNSLSFKSPNDFIEENNYLFSDRISIQALINLQDNFEEDGGFQLLPGIANHLSDWVQGKKGLRREYFETTFVIIPNAELISRLVERITVREGAAIFWNQMTAHGSRPNNSERCRYAQFFKMFRASEMSPSRKELRRKLVEEMVGSVPDFVPSPLGLKIFGLDDWNSDNNNNN